uniref:Uncharacterized protein n=1 Tax=Anas platyrhynchos platyrhynchos TaxID=8840 RepID=A0A493TWV3_ANAPP
LRAPKPGCWGAGKYFTEGLIQFTILLSLIGVRVDVDTYLTSQLPPLREIILGQSSAYTQTQFHNLRNTLDGYGIHPKSVDLDYYFTARRLLNQVRALDRFQVPTTEVSAWLVHRDPEGSVSGTQPSAGIALENGGGLQDGSGPDGSVRESGAEQGFGEELEDLGAVAPPVNGDLTKEVGGSPATLPPCCLSPKAAGGSAGCCGGCCERPSRGCG